MFRLVLSSVQAQQVKLQIEKLAFHTGVPIQVSDALLPVKLPVNVPREAAEDAPIAWVSGWVSWLLAAA